MLLGVRLPMPLQILLRPSPRLYGSNLPLCFASVRSMTRLTRPSRAKYQAVAVAHLSRIAAIRKPCTVYW